MHVRVACAHKWAQSMFLVVIVNVCELWVTSTPGGQWLERGRMRSSWTILKLFCPLANVRRCFIRRSLTCPFNHQKVNHLVSSCQPSDEAGQETYVMNRSIRNLREHTGKKSRYWASTGSSSRWTSPTWTCRHLISANRNRQSTHTHTRTHTCAPTSTPASTFTQTVT